MGKKKEKNNVIKYSRTRDNNEMFKEQVNKNRIKEEDLLGKTRAITLLEKTQLLKPVIEEEEEVVLPQLKKKVKEYKRIVLALLILLLVSVASFVGFLTLRDKFQDIVIEVGSEKVTAKDFLVSNMYNKKASLVTDVSKIDFNKTGKYDVKLKYRDKMEVVSMEIKDTTAPKVEFQDVSEYTGYEVNPQDFIKSIEDYSEVNVDYESKENIDTTKYEDYVLTIIVKDKYGNVTSKDCVLSLGWLKRNVTVEAGTNNIRKSLVVNYQEDAKKIPDSAIKSIDTTVAGEYNISINYDGEEYKSKVTVVDTTAPTLVLRNLSVVENEKVTKEDFISKVKDNSGKVTTKLKTDIKFGKYGKQKVVIEAKDPSGNVTTKEATLTIREDKKGPVFSGLKEVSLKKNSSYDFRKGVKATDNVDGVVDFTYSDKGVSYGTAGTYYVTYTAKDSKGNKTTAKRVVKIKHDASDTAALVSKYAGTLSNDIPTMVNGVRKYIRYSNSWGESDPVWYGLKERRGNCFVHAKVLQAVLNKKGITNKLIWTKDKSHYWNLVYTGGHWRHVDSTPGNNYVLLTDEVMATKLPVKNGGGWDPSGWPATD